MNRTDFLNTLDEFKQIFEQELYKKEARGKYIYRQLRLEFVLNKHGWDSSYGNDFYIRGTDMRYIDESGNIDVFLDTFVVPRIGTLDSGSYSTYVEKVDVKIPQPLDHGLAIPYFDSDDLHAFMTLFLKDILRYGKEWIDSREAPSDGMTLGPNRLNRVKGPIRGNKT